MGAKKAAAGLTTAGLVFIAGCAGGGSALHSGLPTGTSPGQQSARKISLLFTIPHSAAAVAEMPARQSPYAKNRRSVQSQTRVAPKIIRKPKYVSDATINGSISLYVYQGAQLASSQSFTVGLNSTTTDFDCYFIPPIYSSLECYNTGNIYVPGGSDTFYAATYDSQHRMLSLTPGLPGTSVYGTPPAAINVPYSGTIPIQTYGIAYDVVLVNPTPCVNGFGTQFFFQDIDGDIVTGPLAYPVTVNTGTFSMLYANTSVGSNYTFYTAPDPDYWDVSSPSYLSGETGTLSASSPSGTLPVSFPTIYSVNETAFVASPAGLYAIGLVEGGSPSSYPCGLVPLSQYYARPQVVTFSNPVAMTQDGNNAIVVLDDAGTNPTVDVILANALLLVPGVYVPVAQTTLASTGGLDIAATANLQAYILNSDGTIQRVDYSNAVFFPFQDGATNDGAIAGGLAAPAGSSITAFSSTINNDYVFATSYSSPNLYEVDNANTGSPVGGPFNLTGVTVSNVYADMLTSSTVTTAASSDPNNLYASFRAWDGVNTSTVIVTCTLLAGTPCLSNIEANASGSNFGTLGSLATLPVVPALLFSDGNMVTGLYEASTGSSFTFGTTFSPVGTRVVTSPDSMWAGVQQASTFYFAPTATQTPVGSQAGTVSTIWSFPFF
ncbi:MAG: hypothetical protein ABSE64_07230 [Vulcanimicrobiaceae bacterium]|jgi:hypothetical protein